MKTKLLFTLGGLGGGGAERNLINFLNHFNREKFHVEVLCYYKTGVYVESIPSDVNVHYLGKGLDFISNSSTKKVIFKLYKKKVKFIRSYPKSFYNLQFKDFDIEIAFLHDIIPFVAKTPIKRKFGFIRNDIRLGKHSEKKKQQIVHASRNFEQLIAVSEEAKESFITLGGDPNKIVTIYNPIDIENIVKKSKEPFSFENERLNIVAVGRFVPQKRYDRLIDVINQLKNDKNLPEFYVHILGDGELRAEIEQQIQHLELDQFIKLHGFINNPYKIMAQADIITLSSDFEGLPGTICEALALNKPIVATNATGVKELLKNGTLGLITEKSTQSLYEGLKKMLLDKSLREDYKDAIAQNELPFSKSIVLPQLENLYSKKQ